MADSLSPYVDHPDQIHLEDWLAANPVPAPASGGNGGPPLDPPATFADLARIGVAAFGQRWDGKFAEPLGETPRTIYRWRHGQGAPNPRVMGWARQHARQQAMELLAAAGEQDLADAVAARIQSIEARAAEAGRRLLAEKQAAAAARAEAPPA